MCHLFDGMSMVHHRNENVNVFVLVENVFQCARSVWSSMTLEKKKSRDEKCQNSKTFSSIGSVVIALKI